MGTSTMTFFWIMLVIMLVYSASINMITYALPPEAQHYVTGFSDLSHEINLETVSEDVESSIERQTQLPVLDVGALVFYSGNILIDLLLNFAYAIPEMIALLLSGIFMLLNFDAYIAQILQVFLMVIITLSYFIGVISLLLGVRSGRGVI